MRREWIKDLGLTLVVLLAQSGPFLFAQRVDPEPWTFLGAKPARWLVATGLASVLGATGYVIWAVANQAKGIGEFVAGRRCPG